VLIRELIGLKRYLEFGQNVPVIGIVQMINTTLQNFVDFVGGEFCNERKGHMSKHILGLYKYRMKRLTLNLQAECVQLVHGAEITHDVSLVGDGGGGSGGGRRGGGVLEGSLERLLQRLHHFLNLSTRKKIILNEYTVTEG
jgi:hypothetical protein